jgi:hypothetical protein
MARKLVERFDPRPRKKNGTLATKMSRERYIKIYGNKVWVDVPDEEEEKEDYWETRRKAEELRRMSGDDSILGNPAY